MARDADKLNGWFMKDLKIHSRLHDRKRGEEGRDTISHALQGNVEGTSMHCICMVSIEISVLVSSIAFLRSLFISNHHVNSFMRPCMPRHVDCLLLEVHSVEESLGRGWVVNANDMGSTAWSRSRKGTVCGLFIRVNLRREMAPEHWVHGLHFLSQDFGQILFESWKNGLRKNLTKSHDGYCARERETWEDKRIRTRKL
jgi:hypothetical protein